MRGGSSKTEWLSIKDCMERSGYGDSTIRRAIRSSRLTSSRNRNGVARIRVHVGDFEKWMRGDSGKDGRHV